MKELNRKTGCHKVVITGGPCAGKSTGLATIEQELTERGFKVFVLEELATILINSGAAPSVIGNEAFQELLISLGSEREKAYKEIAENYTKEYGKPVVILLDRGILDGKAFMDDEMFERVWGKLSESIVEVRDEYDAVIHLTTAAKGAEEFYTLENNSARTETIEEAILNDDAILEAWMGHPHLRIVENMEDGVPITFEQKIDHLLREIFSLLGEPEPLEIERKYLIDRPPQKVLDGLKAVKTSIVQTYLKSSDPDMERRIRQRGSVKEGFSYYYTEKSPTEDPAIRVEREEKIAVSKYVALMIEADPATKQIKKDRYCFAYKGKYFELDIYDSENSFWNEKAILEVELSSAEDTIVIPEELLTNEVVDVTDDKKYRNYEIAKFLNWKVKTWILGQ